ncbi:MAG: hypothetical protein ACTS7I_02455, partial [Candidatus Hodgkinia cicadicola]
MSDAVDGQNRNYTVTTFASWFAKVQNVTVVQLFPVWPNNLYTIIYFNSTGPNWGTCFFFLIYKYFCFNPHLLHLKYQYLLRLSSIDTFTLFPLNNINSGAFPT